MNLWNITMLHKNVTNLVTSAKVAVLCLGPGGKIRNATKPLQDPTNLDTTDRGLGRP